MSTDTPVDAACKTQQKDQFTSISRNLTDTQQIYQVLIIQMLKDVLVPALEIQPNSVVTFDQTLARRFSVSVFLQISICLSLPLALYTAKRTLLPPG